MQTELKVLGRYYKTFFGVALDITDAEAELVKTISGVKNVYKNYEVKADLMDAVPLIGADRAWERKADGDYCIRDSQDCLTGREIKVAIIDTGVDYTHADLGGNGISGSSLFTKLLPIGSTGSLSVVSFFNNIAVYEREASSYYYNLTSGVEYRLNSDLYKGMFPDIHGDNIIYEEYGENWNYDKLIVYDVSNGSRKELDNFKKSSEPYYSPTSKPEVGSKYATFVTNPNDSGYNSIVAIDIQSGVKRVIQPVPDEYYIFSYTFDDKITYSTQNSHSLYYYDLKDNTNHKLDIGNKIVSMPTDFEDGIIVFDYFDNIYSNKIKVGYYDTVKNSYYLLDNEENRQRNGHYSDGLLYYDDTRFGLIGMDIYTKKKYYLRLSPVFMYAVWDKTIAVNSDNFLYSHTFDLKNDYSKPPLQFPNLKAVGGYDFVNNDIDPMDDHGHGTHVAGIVAGSGVGGLKAVAPDATLYVYKVLNSGGYGNSSNIISAIDSAVDPNNDNDFSDKVDVINLSLGGIGNPDDPMSTAKDNAVSAGIVAVVAAGNSGPYEKTIRSPGTARKAITVGAVDKSRQIANFSSRGPVEWTDSNGNQQSLIKPDVVAPGVNICSSEYDSAWSDKKCFDDKHVAISGTSMATPMVAGSVALLKQAHLDLTPDEMKTALGNTAKNLGYDVNTQGHGMIDIIKVLNLSGVPSFVDLKANGSDGPLTITKGDPLSLSWTTSNVFSCMANFIEVLFPLASGSQFLDSSILLARQTYKTICTDSSGNSVSDSVTVNAKNPVIVYRALKYGGKHQGYIVGTYNLSQMKAKGTLNNDISSVRVAPGYMAVFYDYNNFTGATLTRTANDPNLSDNGWNDRISSMKVFKIQQ